MSQINLLNGKNELTFMTNHAQSPQSRTSLVILAFVVLGGCFGNAFCIDAVAHSRADLVMTYGGAPEVDGMIEVGEYADGNSITFPTAGGDCVVYYKHDGVNLYVAFDVPNVDPASGVQLLIDSDFDQASLPQPDDYRFNIALDPPSDPADFGENRGTGAAWSALTSPVDWFGAYQVYSGFWQAEYAISFVKLGLTAGSATLIGMAFCNTWTTTWDHYWPVGASGSVPATWATVESSDNWAPSIGVVFGQTPTLDGDLTPGEYADADSLNFDTAGGQATVYFKHDGHNLYLAFDLPNTDFASGMQVYLDTNYDQANTPQTDDYRFMVQCDPPADPADFGENQGTGAGWSAWSPSDGWSGAYQVLQSRWQVEFEISYMKLGVSAGTDQTIGIAFCNVGTSTGDYYWPATSDGLDPSSWGSAAALDNWEPSVNVNYASSPLLDGMISAGEYDDAHHTTYATVGGSCTVYYKHDGSYFYVAFDVPNTDPLSSIQLFLDTDYDQAELPQPDDFRFTIKFDPPVDAADFGENQGTGINWSAWGPPVGWSGAYHVFLGYWQAEFVIPYAKLGITAGTAQVMGIAFWNGWTSKGDYYWPADIDWMNPATWGVAFSSDRWDVVTATPEQLDLDPVILQPKLLTGNHPNPFNPRTVIEYMVPQPGRVKIVVCDMIGRQVCKLVDQPQDAGSYTVAWDGRDDNGHRVASGVYVCAMEAEKMVDARKLVLLK